MVEERDLVELRYASLTGVTVGIGSLSLVFASGAQILIQCAFECAEEGVRRCGHGEDVNTSPVLFGYLNHMVESAVMDSDAALSLRFDDRKLLKIVPERNGLESYVITTRHGICPIAVG
ncbi:hypothetical protein [Pandoraea sputorum]|uniref:hypothetical protein n=1 Tax=Pandoraea sputorum TaxID=93222 RepID=UPI0012423E34|nr:hypothetical protein [Pandoraea sputorum]VVE84029.1 hypothetical protein PSP31120_04441 [Pandoraea sputorum]